MTTNWSRFKLLMWKNRIHYKKRKYEIFLDTITLIGILLLLVAIRKRVQPQIEERKDYEKFRPAKIFQLLSYPCPTVKKISFSPNTPPVANLIRESFKYLASEISYNADYRNDTINCFNGESPGATDSESDWIADRIFKFSGYENAAEMEHAIKYLKHDDATFCGIQFDDSLKDIDDIHMWPNHTSLKIRLPHIFRYKQSDNIIFNYLNNLLPFLKIMYSKPVKPSHPDPEIEHILKAQLNDSGYALRLCEQLGICVRYSDGFSEVYMVILHSIYYEFAKMKYDIDNLPDIYLQRLSKPKQMVDKLSKVQEYGIAIIIMLSFYATCVDTVCEIVTEKEKQIKNVFKLMGLPNILYWTTWFIVTFLYLMFSVMIIVILIKFETYESAEATIGYSIFTATPWHLLLLLLIIYAITTICFSFMISTIIQKAKSAIKITVFMWILSYVPFVLISMIDNVNPSSTSPTVTLASCLGSNTALAFGFQIIAKYERTTKGLQWSTISERLTIEDRIIFQDVIIMLIVDAVLYLFIVFCVEVIFPYIWWTNRKSNFARDKNDVEIGKDTNQPETDGIHNGIYFTNLTKGVYIKSLLKHIHKKIFQDRITILLGYNGARKSLTISTLTDPKLPKSGKVTIDGCDVVENIENIRNNVSFCPPNIILYPDLTVAEHIYFYAKFKGVTGCALKSQVDKYLRLLVLGDKRDWIATDLTIDNQKILSIVLALCGYSKVVLLDDPTIGMDHIGRRYLWNLLLLEKIGRKIIVSTQFMPETEYLSERFTIVPERKTPNKEPPYSITKKYDVDYKLTALRQSKKDESRKCDDNFVISIIKKYVSDPLMISDNGSTVVFSLPRSNPSRLELMLKVLKSHQENLSLTNFELSAPVMAEPYTGLDSDLDESFCDMFNPDINDFVSRPLPNTALKRYRWGAMVMKNVGIIKRPLFLVILGLMLLKTLKYIIHYEGIRLYTTVHTLENISDNDLRIKSLYDEFYGTRNSIIEIYNTNMTDHYLENYKYDDYIRGSKIYNGYTFGKNEITIWFPNFGYKELSNIFYFIFELIVNVHTQSYVGFEFISHEYITNATKERLIFEMWQTTFAYKLGIGLTLISTVFAWIHLKENLTRSKAQQMASGVTPFILWTTALIIELFIYAVIFLLSILVTVIDQENYPILEIEGPIILLMFGWAMLPMQYIVSTLFENPTTGYFELLIINTATGIIPVAIMEQFLCYPYSKYKEVAEMVHKVLMIFPHYNAIMQFRLLYFKEHLYQYCSFLCNTEHNMIEQCELKNISVYMLQNKKCFFDTQLELPDLSLNMKYMAVVGLVLYILLLAKEYKIHNYIYLPRHPTPTPMNYGLEDPDVATEHAEIKKMSPSQYHKYSVLCRNVSKYYGKKLVVDKLSLGIKEGECFGLYGVSGSGKSSVIKMLIGQLRMSSGKAWVTGRSVNNDMKYIYRNIGYCPQYDSLPESLTGEETIMIYACIKGLYFDDVRAYIKIIGRTFKYEKYMKKLVETYSPQVKRKLSISIALLGDPKVVFLDEPTAGMNSDDKYMIWDAIIKCPCVIMATRSFDDCEAVCTRIGIIDHGHLLCLGSPQYLKTKFSQGFTVLIKLRQFIRTHQIWKKLYKRHLKALNNYIVTCFPDAKLIDVRHQAIATYHIPGANISWHKIYYVMKLAKEKLKIDYSIGQTTLEQVYAHLINAKKIHERESFPASPVFTL